MAIRIEGNERENHKGRGRSTPGLLTPPLAESPSVKIINLGLGFESGLYLNGATDHSIASPKGTALALLRSQITSGELNYSNPIPRPNQTIPESIPSKKAMASHSFALRDEELMMRATNPPALKPIFYKDTDETTSLSRYFKEIDQVPLLTAVEEVKLAMAYKAGRKANEVLVTNQLLDPKTRKELEKEKESGEAARLKLIDSNLRLVVSVAKKHTGRGVSLMDLIGEGNIGLCMAVERFDYRKGYKLSTYAYSWLRKTILMAIDEQARTIRLPVDVIEAISDTINVMNDLEQQLERKPHYEDIAAQMGITGGKVREILNAPILPDSLEKPIREDREDTLGDTIPDPDRDTAKEGEQNVFNELTMGELKKCLNNREIDILEQRFELRGRSQRTLQKIGEDYGVTGQSIRLWQQKALGKLRASEAMNDLNEWID